MAKLDEVATVMKYLSDTYATPLSIGQVRGYHTVLRDTPRLQLVDAATLWVGREKWFPKPTELLAAAMRVSKPAGDPTTEAAWWFAFAHGYESTDDFTDADVAAIYAEAGVDMGIN